MDCRSSYGDPPYLRTLAASPAWAPAAVELCERGALRAARFGPFTSTPERGWRSLISGELTGLLRVGESRCQLGLGLGSGLLLGTLLLFMGKP